MLNIAAQPCDLWRQKHWIELLRQLSEQTTPFLNVNQMHRNAQEQAAHRPDAGLACDGSAHFELIEAPQLTDSGNTKEIMFSSAPCLSA